MHNTTIKRSAAAAAIAVALGAGYQLGVRGADDASAAGVGEPPVSAAPSPVNSALPDFGSIAERYGPAVVHISTEGTARAAARGGPFGEVDPEDPFSEFLRRFGPQLQPPSERPMHGVGSGFIVSDDGIVLTNAHVVADAAEVTVKLTDKREFKAKVLGFDRATDVAVLKIDASGLPTVPLGDPARTRAGDWVMAIGAPFGFENSVTAGIVSAKSRSLPDEGYVPYLQTDVPINPGNSGGPLLNMDGEVIGINSQIYSRSGGYQGLSFAVPIDVAASVKNQIVAHGKVTRGRIGVAVQDVNQGLADSFGLDKPAGALVSAVEPGGPGERAGLQAGDVILELDGEPVESSGTLPPRVAEIRPGEKARLRVWREGKARDVAITVAEVQDEKRAEVADDADRGRVGLAARSLTPQELQQVGVSGGLLVTDTAGPAAKAGIRRGDVILALNGAPVGSVEELQALLGKAKKHVALLIQRQDAKIFVPVELG